MVGTGGVRVGVVKKNSNVDQVITVGKIAVKKWEKTNLYTTLMVMKET